MEMTRDQVTQAMLENLKPWPSTNENAKKTGTPVQAGMINNKPAEQPPQKGHTMSVISEWDSQVVAAMKTFGISRQQAVIRVARQNPELHQAYIDQTNAAIRARRAGGR